MEDKNENKTADKPSEPTNSSSTLKQVLVAVVTCSLHIVCGCSLAFSGIAIPQILEEQNGTATSKEIMWIGSATALTMPFSCVLSAFTTDTLGRLNSLKFSVVPNLIGWILIATARSNVLLIVGRLCTGFSFGFSTSSAYVYVTEVSNPGIRGTLLSLPGLFIALGILLTYFKGWLLNWKIVAYISLVYSIVPVVIIFLMPESPPWLISKGRLHQARESLEWFRKANINQDVRERDVEHELKELVEKNAQKLEKSSKISLKDLTQPICYKPFVIASMLFVLQQFSGIFIITFNGVIFFKDIGIKMDPYETSIYISSVRVIGAILSVWLTKTFGRRILIITSAGGMAVCMAVSGLFTQWIHNGTTTQFWVPICMVMLYFVFASTGLQSLPFSISSEMFPQSLRGVLQSSVLFVCYSMMFASVYCYSILMSAFGGSSGMQYFFSAVSFVAVVFAYLFLPETFQKKLSDIEEYFWHRTVYVL